MGFGLAGIRLVVEHHVVMRLQVLHGLGEGRCGRQRAVDQDDGLLRRGVAVELGVNPVLPVDLDDGCFRPHVASSWNRSMGTRRPACRGEYKMLMGR